MGYKYKVYFIIGNSQELLLFLWWYQFKGYKENLVNYVGIRKLRYYGSRKCQYVFLEVFRLSVFSSV